MSYTLHFAKTYKVEWDGNYFNWRTDEFDDLFGGEFSGWASEDGNDYEIDKSEVQKYIDKIKKSKNKNKYLKEYTDKEVAKIFMEMLENSDKNYHYIKLNWY